MTHYIIAMKDGWKPEQCAACQFSCAAGVRCPMLDAERIVESHPVPTEQFKLLVKLYNSSNSNMKVEVKE